ncbi:MAG: DUF4253 domain-containing protein [Altererythrobacter sp.]
MSTAIFAAEGSEGSMNRREAMGWFAKLGTMLGLSGTSAMTQSCDAAPDEQTARMIAAFPYPVVTVPGQRALAEWEKLKKRGDGWPVILGSDDESRAVIEHFSIDDPKVFEQPDVEAMGLPPLPVAKPVDEILFEARQIDIPAKLQELFDQEFGEDPFELEAGDWPKPGQMAPMELTVHRDVLSDELFPRVHIAILPTDDPTEAAAYLRWGGWNACPQPEVHVAMHQKWREQYGAEVVGMTDAVINMRAKRRPATRAEAMALAREQFLYCNDIVLQGTNTLEPLAMSLMESDWWYFWWD